MVVADALYHRQRDYDCFLLLCFKRLNRVRQGLIIAETFHNPLKTESGPNITEVKASPS